MEEEEGENYWNWGGTEGGGLQEKEEQKKKKMSDYNTNLFLYLLTVLYVTTLN